MVTILALHHKHMKLVKPIVPHGIAWSVREGFNQSICRTKEQKTRLQCLASAMPKFVMPSAAKNGKVSKEKKRKNLAVLAKTPRLKRFFLARLLSSNVTNVALTRAPENVGESNDISFEAPVTL